MHHSFEGGSGMKLGFPAGALVTMLAIGCAEAPQERPKAPAPPQGETFTSGDYTATLPLGLQAAAAYVPENNPLSEPRIELGRKLYFDPSLSRDGTISCATCHDPDKGFSDARPASIGIGRQTGSRHPPARVKRPFRPEAF